MIVLNLRRRSLSGRVDLDRSKIVSVAPLSEDSFIFAHLAAGCFGTVASTPIVVSLTIYSVEIGVYYMRLPFPHPTSTYNGRETKS